MQAYGDRDVARANWYGLKRLAAAGLTLPIVNQGVRSLARHVLPRHIAHRLPVAAKTVQFRPVHAAAVTLLEPRRDQIAKDIYWGQGRPTSPADARVLRLVEVLCRDASVFLDIGSYSGLFAILAARSNGALRSIAYEIVPENYLLMIRNIIENDLVGQVEAKLLGLGKKNGILTMPAISLAVSNNSSISIGSSFASGVRVPVSTLDADLVDCNGPVVMKIDVEGFEDQVIEGGRDFFRAHRPDVVCEILADAENVEAIAEILAPLGYRYFLSVDGGFQEQSSIRPTEEGRDWIFSARKDIESIFEEVG